MKHAFIMDPLDQVKAWKDTTYFLMLAAHQRGHEVCYVNQQSLWLEHDQAHASVSWLKVNDDDKNPFTVLNEKQCALSEMDVVWIRTDPPFDRRYFYTTLLLEHLPPTTRVVNRPSGIRNWNEKLAALHFPNLTPKTLVSNDSKRIQQFSQSLTESSRITIKPVDGFGGKGIIFYDAKDKNNNVEAIEEATHHGQHWVIAQQYLAAAQQGDKRILLLNGEPLGAILRVHAEGAELNNMDAGGVAQASQLTPQDLKICEAVKPGLIEQGVVFAGIDVIGDMLIEVNVTSPTGLQELCRFDSKDYHHQIIATLE